MSAFTTNPKYQQIPTHLNELEHVEQTKKSSSNVTKFFIFSAVVAAIVFAGFYLSATINPSPNGINTDSASGYVTSYPSTHSKKVFDNAGRFILHDYDEEKPFSNFLAGLGGFWGVPMWVFYVNRGQGITSFGIQNKDGGILKFLTAEKAYQQTPFVGFRTFVRGKLGKKLFNHMPFFPIVDKDIVKPSRTMFIGMNEMEIEEVAPSIGLKTNVLYFTPPDEDYPSLVRSATFTNIDQTETLKIDVLDGLGKLIPSGLPNNNLDAMGRTMEAWMNVYNVANGDFTAPFYHVSQGTADTASVQIIKDGHFALAYVEGRDLGPEGLNKPLPFIVDPSVVFGVDTTLTHPSGLFESTQTLAEILESTQGTTSRTPSAYAGAELVIPPGSSYTITTIYGHAANVEEFLNKIAPKIRAAGYTNKKRIAASTLTDDITSKVSTSTASPILDLYVKQDYLDNILRGGLPVPLGDPNSPKIYHTFSRIHGDIERDYNNFQLDPTYFSQGPGNFRDVNQNRRLDVLLFPVVGDFNVRMFLSFVQADGYNPLTVATSNFKVPAEKVDSLISSLNFSSEKFVTKFKALLAKPFRVGQLFNDVKAAGITFSIDRAEFLSKVVASADQVFAGQYAQNGYWADHWTYTLDLVENYLAVFPDKASYMLWDSTPIPFFLSPSVVKSRKDRYSLVDNPNNKGHSTIRVYGAVSAWGDATFPPQRKLALETVRTDPSFVADSAGAGGIWHKDITTKAVTVSAIAKLAILGILKFSTLDPQGMGVEMEGGKPGWNDAMNGLPGIVGSGMPETYEMFRLLKFVRKALQQFNRDVIFPTEFATFLTSLNTALATYNSQVTDVTVAGQADFDFWDAANTARETYRDSIVGLFSGQYTTVSAADLITAILAFETKTQQGIDRALATNSGLSPSYFYYECTDYEIITPEAISPGGVAPATQVRAKAFKLHTLPLFLEGPTRQFKVVDDAATRRSIYSKVKESTLYDSALEMYTLSESLIGMSQDIGRMMAFSPGWLENQSVWLHMSYKYYLELLRAGLYEEFYAEIKTGLVPYMDVKRYGRSPLEAASFIVSSAFPDPKIHGASFLPRLSGSTAEFLSMWAIMFGGEKPFAIDSNGALELKLSPVLPSWLFPEDGTVSFIFLGAVKVTYRNPKRLATWTVKPKGATVTSTDGLTESFSGGVITGPTAEKVRSHQVLSIEVFY